MESCVYTGSVSHARVGPIDHAFRYSLFMMYLDLDEVPELVRRHWPLSYAKVAPGAFRREDHFGDARMPLADAAREVVGETTGVRPRGPIRMLTQLRYWGHYFSPLNVLYCFDRSGSEVEAVIAEVSNTPWGERHCYVLWDGNRTHPDRLRYRHKKSFHVSPFMGMDSEYLWRLEPPGRSLTLAIETRRDDLPLFHASLSMKRHEITSGSLVRTFASYPVITAKIVAAIYVEALRLWWKKCPFYPHPKTLSSTSGTLRRAS